MNGTIIAVIHWFGAFVAPRRILLMLALFGLALSAPNAASARGGSATAVYISGYDLSTGLIHIQGDGFTPDGKVEVWVYDDSWGVATTASEHQVVIASRYTYLTDCPEGEPDCVRQKLTTGVIDLYSGPYCPREMTIIALDLTTGTVALTTWTNFDCPW